MKFPILVTLAGLAIASPLDARQAPEVSEPVPATGGKNVTAISSDQLHEGILAAMDNDRILNSDELHEYLSNNHGANHTIYLNDTRAFIDMSQVQENLEKRQWANPCFGYVQHYAKDVTHWWGDWHPSSACLYTGKDKAGGNENMQWSYSISVSETAGLSWTIIKDVLSFTSGITVTETWSHSGSITCIVPGNSVGQVWIQNAMVRGVFWSQGCQSCNYGGGCGDRFGYNPRRDGEAVAPVESTVAGQGANWGCSAGYKNTKCSSLAQGKDHGHSKDGYSPLLPR